MLRIRIINSRSTENAVAKNIASKKKCSASRPDFNDRKHLSLPCARGGTSFYLHADNELGLTKRRVMDEYNGIDTIGHYREQNNVTNMKYILIVAARTYYLKVKTTSTSKNNFNVILFERIFLN